MYSWGSGENPTSPVQALLRAKANVNAQDNAGRTPLHILVTADTSFKAEATRALLVAGADPNIRDKQGRPPALAAMTEEWPWSGANDSVPLLAAAGADLTMTDPQGRMILHYLAAMGGGHQDPIFFAGELIAALAKAELDFDAQDQAGDTPLHIAARQSATTVFEWLIAQGGKLAATNDAGVTPRALATQNTDRFHRFRLPAKEDLHEAARRDDVDTIRRLLRAEPQLISLTNQTGETPLRLAAKNHQTNAVAALLAAGATWDETSAAMLGRADALQPILSRNPRAANAMAYGRPLLHWAAESGDGPTVELLLTTGAKLDARERAGTSALAAAIRSNRTEVVALLRRRGGAENLFDCIALDQPELAVALVGQNPALGGMPNGAGFSPVQMAVALGRNHVLAVLLEQQIPTAPTDLHIAAVCNRTNEAVLLLQRGADVAALDDRGMQPLHYAAAANASDLITLLARHGAKPDAPVQTPRPRSSPRMLPAGTTALHLAAVAGHTNAIVALLRAGANVNATNATGLTAVDLVHYCDFPEFRMSSFGPLALPGYTLSMKLAEIGVRVGRPPPPVLFTPIRQAVIVQLEQAGAQHGKPTRDPGPGF
jgi:cytohesin